MRIAYADPPYIGCAKYYPENEEVNHQQLIENLNNNYEGWAISTHVPGLWDLLPMIPRKWGCRIGAWVKPFCSFKPNVNPAYAWEPVIFKPARKRTRNQQTIRDWVSANITLKKGVVGAKPYQFCYWLFAILGMEMEDEFIDLFPGTGIVTKAWEYYKKQYQLFGEVWSDEINE